MPLKVRSPEPLSSGVTRKEYAPSVSGKAANGWAVAPAGQAGKVPIHFNVQEETPMIDIQVTDLTIEFEVGRKIL